MGLFSKLFGKSVGDDEEKKKTLSLLDSLFEASQKNKKEEKAEKPAAATTTAAPAPANTYDDDEEDGPSGFSWGPKMPAEANQYNFNGTWKEYFRDVFTKEFAEYTLDVQDKSDYMKFTFLKAGATALVVEIVSASSEYKKVRSECEQKNIPYLRYYYNYHGWWNVREYVIQRTRSALGI